jgi:hypothetical protein
MDTATAAAQPLPAQAIVMQMAMGAILTKVVNEATRLNIPDLVKAHGPLTVSEILAKGSIDGDASALERVLRACAAAGIFSEDASGRFGPTELSDVLTVDSSVSVKKIMELFGGHIARVVCELPGSIKTGGPQSRAVFGLDFWDFLNANPKELEQFGESMKSNSINSLYGVLEHCDFSGARHVADIGGGFGHLALALLQKYPNLQATVLDVPEVIPVALEHLRGGDPAVVERLEYAGQDMFESVPPADVYIMKHIIHDWEDEKCIRLLDNCRRSMEGDGRVVCVDAVVPPLGDSSGLPAKLMDIVMLTFITGKERTERQWSALYEAAGLEIHSITPIRDNFGTSIVEGRKRRG